MAKLDFYNRTTYDYLFNGLVSQIQIIQLIADTLGGGAINIHASIGPIINQNIEIDIKESDDGVNFTPVNKEELIIPNEVYSSNPGIAAFLQPSAKTALIGYRGKKRYLEIKSLVGTGSDTTNYNIVIQKLHLPSSFSAAQG